MRHDKFTPPAELIKAVWTGPVLAFVEIMDYNGDLNGTERWSVQGIQERYAEYARRFRVSPPLDLRPREHVEAGRRWIFWLMDEVIEGIEQGDLACIELGVEFIEEDRRFSRGKTLKSNTARALRRAVLDASQVERIRYRVVDMLTANHVPHEYHEYARLLRKVGLGVWWPWIVERVDRNNPYVMRYYRYFEQYARPEGTDPDPRAIDVLVEQLVEQLRSADESLRQEAVRGLRGLDTREARQVLYEAYQAGWLMLADMLRAR